LEHYGIRGPVLSLLTSYLCDRKQLTLLNGCSSSYKQISYGVPQGSVLGPLLFLLYINDFQHCCNANFRFFADDTAVIISHAELDLLFKLANDYFQKIQGWLISNKLLLNINKTFSMFFHKNKRNTLAPSLLPAISLQGKVVSFVRHIKYLGFVIDEQLSFKDHILYLISKLRKYVGIFWKIGPLLNKQTRYLIYNSLFHSNLAYGIELYGNSKKICIQSLQVLQNRAIKGLFQMNFHHPTRDLYKEFAIQNINTLFSIRASIMLWQFQNQPFKLNIHNLYTKECSTMMHKYPTREKSNSYLHFNRLSHTKQCNFQNAAPLE